MGLGSGVSLGGSGVSLGTGVELGVAVGVSLGSGVRVRVLVGVKKGVPSVGVGLGVAEGRGVALGARVGGITVQVEEGSDVEVGWGGDLSAINIVSAQ